MSIYCVEKRYTIFKCKRKQNLQVVLSSDFCVNSDFNPRFLRRYCDLSTIVNESVTHYIKDVKNLEFPNKDEEYH